MYANGFAQTIAKLSLHLACLFFPDSYFNEIKTYYPESSEGLNLLTILAHLQNSKPVLNISKFTGVQGRRCDGAQLYASENNINAALH